MKRLAVFVVFALLLMVAAATADPADGITLDGYFSDDNGHLFEADIDAIAAVGITKGCNPPANTRYCPDDNVERGAMAAFIRRALNLPASGQDFFSDDNNSVFEDDINAIASANITKGCNPPANNRFCPNDDVTRGQMAAFLKRALNLASPIEVIPVGYDGSMICSKDGERCQLVVNLSPSRNYRVQEGIFQATPASVTELDDFNAGDTRFTLTLDGAALSISELGQASQAGLIERRWRRNLQFPSGTHTLVARWLWDGVVFQTNTIIINASG